MNDQNKPLQKPVDYSAQLSTTDLLMQCIEELEKANSIITSMEYKSVSIIDNAQQAGEIISPALENAFHVMTHEEGTTIGFQITDLKNLLAQNVCRNHYSMLSDEEFQTIIQTPWSTTLTQKTHKSIVDRHRMNLLEVSALIKKAQAEWGLIGKVYGKYE